MANDAVVEFEFLAGADLVVDAVYLGGSAGNVTDDPIRHLLPVGNSGGIRPKGPLTKPLLVALITSGVDLDWPDQLDVETGELVYYGDNRTGGRELHDTPRGGNVLLRNLFDAAHGAATTRSDVAPILVFTKTGVGRAHKFLGLAVPGSQRLNYSDELLGIWRSKNGSRYQNYRATFTILDVPMVTRIWLDDILAGQSHSANAPKSWIEWSKGGLPRALTAPKVVEYRTKMDQTPTDESGRRIVQTIYEHFRLRPTDFEIFAADLVQLQLPDVTSLDVTRPSRDGGRDAIGLLRIGVGPGAIVIDFSMEAKCYRPGNSVGVRELSRLISRLRHRQFGVLVTTSHLDLQAYKELKEDRHPIIVISGSEIAQIVSGSAIPRGKDFKTWLESAYPIDTVLGAV